MPFVVPRTRSVPNTKDGRPQLAKALHRDPPRCARTVPHQWIGTTWRRMDEQDSCIRGENRPEARRIEIPGDTAYDNAGVAVRYPATERGSRHSSRA